MRGVLTALAQNKHCSSTRGTQKALAARGLIDPDGQLTHLGWQQAAVLLPLPEQCALVGIEYELLPGIRANGEPEIAAWKHFSSKGWVGAFCEGGPVLLLLSVAEVKESIDPWKASPVGPERPRRFLLLLHGSIIRSAALDTLARLNSFGSRQDACTRFTEAQLTILRNEAPQILVAIRAASSAVVVAAFKEIYSSLMVQEYYPGLTSEVIATLFEALGAERLASIAEAIIEDPYTYRSGWPDLTMTRGGEMQWVEIKTTDKLHMSQVTTIHRMKPLLPGSVRVVQLAAVGDKAAATSNYPVNPTASGSRRSPSAAGYRRR